MANIKVEVDAEESAFDIDVARDRFESALHQLRNKEDLTTSENESDTETKTLQNTKIALNKETAPIPIRASRKRRRKEFDIRDIGFHQTYVMRMFDRSVDLAQFEESSPLYPICRAWMLNYPNSEQGVKNEPSSPLANEIEDLLDHESNDRTSSSSLIKDLPSPDPWKEDSRKDCRIPSPIPHPSERLTCINGMDCGRAVILGEHLTRWRKIRNNWRQVGVEADVRYAKTHYILKNMFER